MDDHRGFAEYGVSSGSGSDSWLKRPPAGAVPADQAVIDENELLGRVENDFDLLGAIFDLFLDSAQEMRDSIWQARRAGDRNELANNVHSLKGMLGNISAKQAMLVSMALEKQVQNADWPVVDEGLAALSYSLDVLCDQISDRRGHLGC